MFSSQLSQPSWFKGRKIHCLKVWIEYFSALESGIKTFELRAGHFEVNDVLLLDEFCPVEQRKTGKSLVFRIVYAMKIAENPDGLCLPFSLSNEPVWCLGLERL